MVSLLKNGANSPISQICGRILNKQNSEEKDELCKGVPLNSKIAIRIEDVQTLSNINVGLKLSIGVRDFSTLPLFQIERKDRGESMSLKDFMEESYFFEFMLARSGDQSNTLGVNFLEGKILGLDAYLGIVSLQNVSTPKYYSADSYGLFVAIKVTIDIFIFIFLITLIFSTIIGFDKFINEDEG